MDIHDYNQLSLFSFDGEGPQATLEGSISFHFLGDFLLSSVFFCTYFGNCRNTDGTSSLWNLWFVFPWIKQDSMKCSLHKQLAWEGDQLSFLTALIHCFSSSEPFLGNLWKEIPESVLTLFVQPKAAKDWTILINIQRNAAAKIVFMLMTRSM